MSRQLVARSPDLLRLREEGYDIAIDVATSHLLVRAPYVTAEKTVARGTLVSSLTLSGETTAAPGDHVVWFVGATPEDKPCDRQGHVLEALINQHGPISLGGELIASCSFSHKPEPTYPDYYEKMSTYADMLLAHVQVIDPDATVRTFPPVPAEEEESVFRYLDSASARAQIGAVTDKLRGHKLVIIGGGGTGSYILDLVTKTPAETIHVYDRDVMLTHNAFRSPGAASLEELIARPRKVDYLLGKYDAMHRGVVAHPEHVDAANIDQLQDADFVFIAIDDGPAKKFIIENLQAFGVRFIDVGMGLYQHGDSLAGLVRTTTSVPGHGDHIWENDRISFADEDDDVYDQNIQIADLNMLNAALAVIKWKKIFAFYIDLEHELSSTYTIDGNHMLNEDHAP